MRSLESCRVVVIALVAGFILSGGPLVGQEDAGPRFDWRDGVAPAPLQLAEGEADRGTGSAYEPALAGGMSYLLPGGGQFYNGQTVKGGLMLAGFTASVVYALTAGLGDREVCAGEAATRVCSTHPHWPNSRFWMGLGGAVGIQAWSILDAIAVANRRARGPESGTRLEVGARLLDGEPALAAGVRVTP